MIVAFSTSSPWTSVAVFDSKGGLVANDRLHAPMQASGACLTMMSKLITDLSSVELFLADVGPGSFTGTRVGVTLAKTFAFARGGRVAGVSSFDLISHERAVAIPSKKGEYFVRLPGEAPCRVVERPDCTLIGFGPWFVGHETYPDASRFSRLIPNLKHVDPGALVPAYLIEPNISLPKHPFPSGGAW